MSQICRTRRTIHAASGMFWIIQALIRSLKISWRKLKNSSVWCGHASYWMNHDIARITRRCSRVLQGILYRHKFTRNVQVDLCSNHLTSEKWPNKCFWDYYGPKPGFFWEDARTMECQQEDSPFPKCVSFAYWWCRPGKSTFRRRTKCFGHRFRHLPAQRLRLSHVN